MGKPGHEGEMIKQLTSWVMFLAAVFGPGLAQSQTFNFSASDFQTRLNKALVDDHGDTIKECKRDGADYRCTFNDAVFQKSVSAFKELNLANGNFALKEVMFFTVEGGKVSRITIGGDRSDPINAMHTVGQIGGVIEALKPSIKEDDVQRLIIELGLMRGDSDESIGTPKTAIEDFAAIKCNTQDSHVSTLFGCTFLPRF
jgi:hypothetical protein